MLQGLFMVDIAKKTSSHYLERPDIIFKALFRTMRHFFDNLMVKYTSFTRKKVKGEVRPDFIEETKVLLGLLFLT